jgi:hypothetical protein
MLVSWGKRSDGTETMSAKMFGKAGYAQAEKIDGQWILKVEGQPDRALGADEKEAVQNLPGLFGEATAQTKAKAAESASGSKDVAFTPKGKAVLGGQIDFDMLHEAAAHHPAMLKAVRYYLGVDDEGYHTVGELTQKAAAKKGGLGDNSQAGLSKALRAMGITEGVRNQFRMGESDAPPLPGTERSDDVAPTDYDAAIRNSKDTKADRTVADEVVEQKQQGLSDEYLKDDAEQGDEWHQGMGTTSSVGGSIGDIADTEKGMIHEQSWYDGPMTKAEGDVTRVPLADFAKMAVRAIDYVSPENIPVMGLLMTDLRRRMGVDMKGTVAAIEKAQKEHYGNNYKAPQRGGDATGSDGSETDVDESDVEEELDGNIKFSKTAEPVTVEVNGEAVTFAKPETAIKTLQDKVDRYKSLLNCLMR